MSKLNSEQRARLEEAGNILAQARAAISEAHGLIPVTGDAELVCLRRDVQKMATTARWLSEQSLEIAKE